MTPLPIEIALDLVIKTLEANSVPYALMGGFGVRLWGLPRPTYDADLTVAVEPGRLPHLLADFQRRGFDVPEAHLTGFVDRVGPFPKISVTRIEAGIPIDVDLFLASTAYQRVAMSRRVEAPLGSSRQWVLSREDIILHKLIAGRKKDIVDVDEILLVAMSVDRDYLRRWASGFGVEKALEEALSAAPHLR